MKDRSSGLYVSPLLVLMLAAGIAFGYAAEILSYLAAVVMHELCHAAYAAKKGYTLSAFKLMPYGACLTGAFEGAPPADEIKIALVGPASNAVTAVATVALWWIAPETYFYTEIFAAANVFTALVNLVPVFPLDGGRALLAALSVKFRRARVYKGMRAAGLVFSLTLFGLAFVPGLNPSFLTLSAFIFFSTVFPDRKCRYERLYSLAYRREKIRSGLAVREVMVFGDSPVGKLLKMLSGGTFTRFVIVDDNLRVLGTVTETELETLAVRYGHTISVYDAKFSKKS